MAANKYQNSKIYKLVCNQTGLAYYGSTIQPLYKRKSTHKAEYNRYIKTNAETSYLSSFKIIENNNYDIVLVEELTCENVEQLRQRERFYIENNECVNKNIPSRTRLQYNEDKKETIKEQTKQYREQNKEIIIERHKQYREQNRSVLADKSKQYYEQNKVKISERRKKLRENSKLI